MLNNFIIVYKLKYHLKNKNSVLNRFFGSQNKQGKKKFNNSKKGKIGFNQVKNKKQSLVQELPKNKSKKEPEVLFKLTKNISPYVKNRNLAFFLNDKQLNFNYPTLCLFNIVGQILVKSSQKRYKQDIGSKKHFDFTPLIRDYYGLFERKFVSKKSNLYYLVERPKNQRPVFWLGKVNDWVKKLKIDLFWFKDSFSHHKDPNNFNLYRSAILLKRAHRLIKGLALLSIKDYLKTAKKFQKPLTKFQKRGFKIAKRKNYTKFHISHKLTRRFKRLYKKPVKSKKF